MTSEVSFLDLTPRFSFWSSSKFIITGREWCLFFLLSYNRRIINYYLQVGMQASAKVSVGLQIGDEVQVQVEEAHPRDDVLSLMEVVEGV